ncbi:MAG: hypothetical protein Q4G11_06940, partial [Gallicola sp.]|nr:hypothetical protein [Gallicola sp.]
ITLCWRVRTKKLDCKEENKWILIHQNKLFAHWMNMENSVRLKNNSGIRIFSSSNFVRMA